MQFQIWTRKEEFILRVKVQTASPQKIRIILRDADPNMPYTELTNRRTDVNGIFTFNIRVPQSGMYSILEITNDITNDDSSFKIVGDIERFPLEKFFDVTDMNNPAWRDAVRFFQPFCYNAGVLMPGRYISSDDQFCIDYLPQILSDDTGLPLNTCARINKETGIIQASRAKMQKMTVPGRMCIFLHEYSHFFENGDINNEHEADLNALLIYMALGYPRIDAYNVFYDAFMGAATELNESRYMLIKQFITEFDQERSILYQN